jgi:hypothetical protein
MVVPPERKGPCHAVTSRPKIRHRIYETQYSYVRRFKLQARKFLACFLKLSSVTAAVQGRRHDHETTVDHALMRGLVTAGPVMRRGASSV